MHSRRDGKEHDARQRGGKPDQHRLASADVVGHIAEKDERADDHQGIDGKNRGRYGRRQMPFSGVERVAHGWGRAGPQGVDDNGGGDPEACPLSQRVSRTGLQNSGHFLRLDGRGVGELSGAIRGGK